MKRNREVIQGTEIDWVTPTWKQWQIDHPRQPSVPTKLYERVYYLLASEILDLYYPDVYVLPTTPDGEVHREMLYGEYDIFRYGCYEYSINYENELYTIILVNND
jgi:hypothetical protein